MTVEKWDMRPVESPNGKVFKMPLARKMYYLKKRIVRRIKVFLKRIGIKKYKNYSEYWER